MTDAKADCKNTNVDNFDWAEYHQAHIEQQESDIGFMTSVFRSMDSEWKSWEEMAAWDAQVAINAAKQKIKELREEIERQEAIIHDSEKIVIKFRRQTKSSKSGRPERSQEKERIAKRFVSQWILSLMNSLEVKSCGQLEKIISGTTERNWRRWQNGDAIPTAKTFEKLLDNRIDRGQYAGCDLQKIPSKPQHQALLTLLRFI